MDDKESEEILSESNEAQKSRWLHIFVELSKSKRFTEFVNDNFDIQDEVDHEAKTITTMVIEKPLSIGPALAPEQKFKLGAILAASGAKDVQGLMQGLLKILGQEKSPIVIPGDVDFDTDKMAVAGGITLGNRLGKKLK